MNMKCLPLGDYETNCYILWNDDCAECVVIDPGYTPELILDAVNRLGLSIKAILLTHGHFDHVGGVKKLRASTGCAVWMHRADLQLPTFLTAGKLEPTDFYDEGDTITIAGLSFRVLSTPGHTPGSVCLMAGNSIFSGDTLFAGSCGRIDFSGGSGQQMRRSLARLAALKGNYRVYPGHGSATTLDRERFSNPYLTGERL